MDRSQVKRKRLLICGDSYMALSPALTNKTGKVDLESINKMHWSQHLNKDYEVLNNAQPGSSNLMILEQLKKGLQFYPSAIVIGFTSFDRLEVYVPEEYKKLHPEVNYITSCNLPQFSSAQQRLYSRYLTEYPKELKWLNQYALIEYMILLARSAAPTVHVMNLADLARKDSNTGLRPCILDAWASKLPMNLMDAECWGPDDSDIGSFHVKDPEYHIRFAKQIDDWLLTL